MRMEMMLEVIPPPRRSGAEAASKVTEKIWAAVRGSRFIRYLNIPEITEENYAGIPLYKHMDNCEFGAMLHKRTGMEIVANKVTPYVHSESEFKTWLKKSVSSYGIRRFVFVGSNSKTRKYPGPPVVRANEMASKMGNIDIGNICIPSRPNEAGRMATKTKTGATFFTTQLLFEPSAMERVLNDYSHECARDGVKPATVFLSLAPVSSHYDLEFFKWLGVEIPDGIERKLRKENGPATASIIMAADLFYEIHDFVKGGGLKLKVFPNVEAISNANLGLARSMADLIAERS